MYGIIKALESTLMRELKISYTSEILIQSSHTGTGLGSQSPRTLESDL